MRLTTTKLKKSSLLSICLQGLKSRQGERDELNHPRPAAGTQVSGTHTEVTVASFPSVQMLLCYIGPLCKAVHVYKPYYVYFNSEFTSVED